jgi:hypothetical protein
VLIGKFWAIPCNAAEAPNVLGPIGITLDVPVGFEVLKKAVIPAEVLVTPLGSGAIALSCVFLVGEDRGLLDCPW